MPNLPRAILFDLDDTILANDPIAAPCWQEACREIMGAAAPSLVQEIFRLRDWYWSDPVRHRRGRMNMIAARAELVFLAMENRGGGSRGKAREISSRFDSLIQERLQPFPGAIETLRELKTRGVSMALVTNGASAYQRGKVERFGLDALFDQVLIEGELGFGKPDPEVYRVALERLQVRADAAWMIGDRLDWEVEAPQKLGIRGIWNDHRGAGLPAGSRIVPHRIVRSIREILP